MNFLMDFIIQGLSWGLFWGAVFTVVAAMTDWREAALRHARNYQDDWMYRRVRQCPTC